MNHTCARWSFVVAAALAYLASTPSLASEAVPQSDLLNAEVWMQTAIEYRANCLTVYALANIRLDEALADKTWTAYDQTGSYQEMPPAVMLDLVETAIDQSAHEAGLVVNGADFDRKMLGQLDQGRTGKGDSRRGQASPTAIKGREGVLHPIALPIRKRPPSTITRR